MKADALLKVRILTADEGGRNGPMLGDQHHCICVIEGDAFDCVLFYSGMTLELGKIYELPIRFLSPELVLPKLAAGKRVALRELRKIADGTVVSVQPHGPVEPRLVE